MLANTFGGGSADGNRNCKRSDRGGQYPSRWLCLEKREPDQPGFYFSGTTWVQLKDRAIIAAGGSYANGSTGGRASVTLTTKEMPAHNHSGSTSSAGAHTHTAEVCIASSTDGTMAFGHIYIGNATRTTSSAGAHSHSVSVRNTGNGKAFSILNPYIVRYMWERIG